MQVGTTPDSSEMLTKDVDTGARPVSSTRVGLYAFIFAAGPLLGISLPRAQLEISQNFRHWERVGGRE